MRTTVAGIRAVGLAWLLLASIAVSGCGPGGRSADVLQPGVPSGVARPVTGQAAQPPVAATSVSPVVAMASVTVSTTSAAGFSLLVLHTNDTRGYTLPCG